MSTLRRILYLEDEPGIRKIVSMALVKLGGFELQVCASGAEAIAAAPSFAPDLLLIDMMLPGMDGPTTLASLRKLPCCATTPVVFMTARAQPADFERLASLGAIEVIRKPFDPMKLHRRLLEIWETKP